MNAPIDLRGDLFAGEVLAITHLDNFSSDSTELAHTTKQHIAKIARPVVWIRLKVSSDFLENLVR